MQTTHRTITRDDIAEWLREHVAELTEHANRARLADDEQELWERIQTFNQAIDYLEIE